MATSIESLRGLSAVPTLMFIVLSVFVGIRIARSPIGWAGIGFNVPFRPVYHLALGTAGAALAVGTGALMEPVWHVLFGSGRDLSRFSSASESVPGLLLLLVFSWSFAAFGEEFTFRGILMRGMTAVRNGCPVSVFPYIFQAVVFGLIHAYQGPAGVAGATLSGLIFGGVVWIAGGSLWPAVIAHGLSNTYGICSLWLQTN